MAEINNKKVVWSYSSINLYRTCPNQWRAKYRDKEVEFQATSATIWGNEVHKEAEMCIKENREPTERYKLLQPYLNTFKKLPGTMDAEVELAVTEDLKPCGFWDKDAWLRGKLDVLINQETKGIITDWKTGSAKPNDFGELRCFSLLTFLNFEEIEQTKNIYIWLKKDHEPTSEIVKRGQQQELLDNLAETIHKIEESLMWDRWYKKKSGLCGQWCDVISCEHNGKRK